MKLYGLFSENKGCLMALGVSSADNGQESTYYLTSFFPNGYDALWVTSDKAHADKVAADPQVPWYNSSFNSPEWRENDWGKLTVVELSTFELPPK